MKRFTNPLDNIRVASPCKADWNQMYGNDRKRFCSECKLNVYNLSDMKRDEAESFLMASEGRVCVRYFRRADGTVLTKNCPVGWQAVKQRVSRVITAALSLILGFFGGLFALRAFNAAGAGVSSNAVPAVEVPAVPVWQVEEEVQTTEYEMGKVAIAGDVDLTEFRKTMNVKSGK